MKQHARNDLGSTTGELTQANFEKLAIIKDEPNVNQQTFSFSLRRRKRSNDDMFTVKAQHSCILLSQVEAQPRQECSFN